ncbi:MAG TPA: nicotinate-nucleotide--dimethylbenzimidazole phosphoribosyltransferase [Steroidobacteraceae bacterium]
MSFPSPDPRARALAEARQAALVKPRGALGQLETVACWLAARQQRAIPKRVTPAITVFAADHGVARSAVSAYPQSVTAQMLASLTSGGAAISVLARTIDAPLTIVDVGVATNAPPPPGVRNERIAPGTRDITLEPAMTLEQARQALATGARYAASMIERGADLLIAGEIGIGNTTSSACIVAAALGTDPERVVGHGSGISTEQRARKVEVVRQALARCQDRSDGVTLLAELGGFEIGAMAGLYLEAARAGIPCVLDGFISSAAALIACRIDERVREWLLASHLSCEQGHAAVLEELRLEPLIKCGLRLGEGTGAALAVPMIQAAIRLHAEMATFAEAGVSDSV